MGGELLPGIKQGGPNRRTAVSSRNSVALTMLTGEAAGYNAPDREADLASLCARARKQPPRWFAIAISAGMVAGAVFDGGARTSS